MKAILTLFLIFTELYSFSQSYHEFSISNTIWNIYNHDVWTDYNWKAKRYIFYDDTAIINRKMFSRENKCP